MPTAIAPWPTTINVTNFSSDYTESMDTNFTEFAPDVGPPKRRRRMGISSDTLQFTMFMTEAETETFRSFYRNTLQDGTLPFTFPKPRTGIIETYTFSGSAPTIKFFDYGIYLVTMHVTNIPNTYVSWLPLLNSGIIPSIVPDTFADFTTEGSADPHYWYAGNKYASFAAWLGTMGGTYTRASAANYFVNGVMQTAAANVARFPGTGIRLCGQNTELCLQNRTPSVGAPWGDSNVTVTQNQTGVDGVANSACLVTATAANAQLAQAITAASGPYIMGAWLKRITGTGTIQLSIDNGTTRTTVVPTSTWTFFQISAPQTLANPTPKIIIATSGDAIAVDFVSVRGVNGVGSAVPIIVDPIATTTTTVTQNCDQLTFPWTLGTTLSAYLATINQLQNNENPRLLTFVDSGPSALLIGTSNQIEWKANALTLIGSTVNPLTTHKSAVSVSPISAVLAIDAVSAGNLSGATLGAFSTVALGPYLSGAYDSVTSNGDFSQLAIWGSTAASAADLVRLT